MQRTMVVWVPDWPVLAAVHDEAAPTGDAHPIAIMSANRVVACSAAARAHGVHRGQKRRDAQGACPHLVVVAHDDDREHRHFAPLIDAVEARAAGVQIVRPGLLALAARGPARYYGGEKAAALALISAVLDEGVPDARVGVSDGPFAADRAARDTRPDSPVRIVAEGAAAAYLAPLPVSTLADPELAILLTRLGVRTLGAFTALPAASVRERFGPSGAHAHALAGAIDATPIIPRTPPDDLERVIELEPPLDRVDQIAFAVRQLADDVVETLATRRLVATAVRVSVRDESGRESDRVWLHPRAFRASEIVDRVRWQLSGSTRRLGEKPDAALGPGLASPVDRVSIAPDSVDATTNHEPGLWGGEPDDRVHHALSRVQSMLGHESVVTAQRAGGRTLAERRILVPWGDRAVHQRPLDRPWPGALPQPAPATVFPSRHAVTVIDGRGDIVLVDDRLRVTGAPAAFAPAAGGATRPIRSWAGPWPLDERWWDATQRRRLHRLQVVDEAGIAWLLVLDGGSWWAEARYD